MKVTFMTSKDNDDKRVMHSKSDDIEVMIGNGKGEVINKLFQSLLPIFRIINERF